MSFPKDLHYTKEHEWVKQEEGNTFIVGITEYAQRELGDIVYVEVETIGKTMEAGEVFGTVEAVKTVSDLFLTGNWHHIRIKSRTGKCTRSCKYRSLW